MSAIRGLEVAGDLAGSGSVWIVSPFRDRTGVDEVGWAAGPGVVVGASVWGCCGSCSNEVTLPKPGVVAGGLAGRVVDSVTVATGINFTPLHVLSVILLIILFLVASLCSLPSFKITNAIGSSVPST